MREIYINSFGRKYNICKKCKKYQCAPNNDLCALCLKKLEKSDNLKNRYIEPERAKMIQDFLLVLRRYKYKKNISPRPGKLLPFYCTSCGRRVAEENTQCAECLYFDKIVEKIKAQRIKSGTWDGELISIDSRHKIAMSVVLELIRRGDIKWP